MTFASQLCLSGLSDSPYAAELRRGLPALRFNSPLEEKYLRSYLHDNKTIIRVACLLATLVALYHFIEQIVIGAASGILLFDIAAVLATSAVLMALAWTKAFERRFVPWAQIIVPTRNIIIAAHVAAGAASGRLEMLLVLPFVLIGPFFFLGLRYRVATASVALSVISFAFHALVFKLPVLVAARCCVFLTVGLIACAIAARQIERWSRRSFLETHLLAELAEHDGLTGTKNRRVLDEHVARVWAQALEDGRRVAILLADVDHFKTFNDRYGHQAGDQTLRHVAQEIQRFVSGPLDILARYGGEEFVAVLYDSDVDQASNVAEQMRGAVESLDIEHRGSRIASHVTISIGIAVVRPTTSRTPRGALQLADEALYTAKIKGRNRVELMTDVDHRMLVTGMFSRATEAV